MNSFDNEDSFLMFDGSIKKISELINGDILTGIEGEPVEIIAIKPVQETTYTVIPVKGDSYIANASDIISVKYSTSAFLSYDKRHEAYYVKWFDISTLKTRYKYFFIKNGGKEHAEKEAEDYKNRLKMSNINQFFNISVKKYNSLSKGLRSQLKGYRISLDFPESELPLDPYILGAWLGDGSSYHPNITTVDKEILDFFKEYMKKHNLVLKQCEDEITYRIACDSKKRAKGQNYFRNFLQNENLFKNKHIPKKYLFTSRQNRLKLLAGLLDTDGSYDRNSYDFVQKKEKLFDDFLFLCRSLGFSCYKSIQEKTCTNSKNGPVTGTYFRCSVSGKGLEEIPCLLERKKAKPRKQIKDVLVTGISLEKNETPRKSFRIITDKNNFLMSDLTVRHSYRLTSLSIIK